MPPLTEQAHAIIRQVVRPGDIAIDATAGNGHDTKFLAELVGLSGHVFSIDIQHEALQRTAALLGEAALTQVHLMQGDHAGLKTLIPGEHHGRIAAVMFNLGYLPGGNRSLATRTDSSLRAIRSALGILQPGGILTAIAYTGHPGGSAEAVAVESLLLDLSPAEYEITQHSAASERAIAPCLFVVTKSVPPGGPSGHA
jgi:SAM-dependent methyltransferase